MAARGTVGLVAKQAASPRSGPSVYRGSPVVHGAYSAVGKINTGASGGGGGGGTPAPTPKTTGQIWPRGTA